MNPDIQFSLAEAPLDAAALTASIGDHNAGAVVTFEGRVRNHNEGKSVVTLEYQAYPALALPTGRQILVEEAAKAGVLAIHAVHRTGVLTVGEVAVWVAVASAHRGPAFDAARAVMERLKYELPVWKKETYSDGPSVWVEAGKGY